MISRWKTLTTMLAGAAAVISPIVLEITPAYIWNASESVPIGLYRLQLADTLFVTELLAVQPPEPLATFLDLNGYLPAGLPILKRVLALPGQIVCRSGLTISVDAIEMGEARDRDGRGRPLPKWQGCRVVGEGELFVMNWQSTNSLDGRYFGFLPASAVIGRALPVWTWEECPCAN
ncbi:S26 family signal peptidase [Bradyrhizobium sp. Arg816]|uniref:S26 family signal peptidase n=1 Tax=Bradyrhizobium sp. Arg816 TaxID=2998491 RepID=UPI00249E0055|nr:S26 family signal peptidase [Bradyrhizobium sp. Arg816]MDI3563367.1 S26 family signal peptidase [Bradyrhizobium sp. Arg816]